MVNPDTTAEGDEPSQPGGGTTPYQRMVETAARVMQTALPMPDVTVVAQLAGVEGGMANAMFADDDALCAAVAEDAMVRLGAFVNNRVAAAPLDDPAGQIRAMLVGYIDWVHQDGLGARMLVDHKLPLPCRQVYLRYVIAMQTLWRSLLGRAEEAGHLRPPMNAAAAELLSRSLVVGLGRILLGDEDDYLRDKDDALLHAEMVEAINIYCDVIFQ